MSDKPLVRVAHRVDAGGQDFRYYPVIHAPFMKLMASLYPQFASYTKAEKGYSVFTGASTFVGCFGGLTLQSVRRNPVLYDDGRQLFLRALLGGLHLDGYKHHSSVCSPDNYGTLRLWQKLGLGAKLDSRGKARSADRNEDSAALLADLVARAKPGYDDVRAYAERRMGVICLYRLMPSESAMPSPPRQLSVSLSVD